MICRRTTPTPQRIRLNWDNVGHAQSLPGRLQSSLTRALEDDEQVIWFEQPDVRLSRRKAYSAVPFGLAALALAWHGSSRSLAGWYWVLGYLVLLGLILVALPWIAQAQAQSTLYVITDRRALILTTGKKDALRAYSVQQLPQLEMRRRVHGCGDLVFETEYFEDPDASQGSREHGFEDIHDVDLVRQILEHLRRGLDVVLVRRHAALWRLA